jgi:hypothetical protein
MITDEEKKQILGDAIPRMNELKRKSLEEDTEGAHCAADALLCEILDKLGFEELTKIFWDMERWYA